MNVMQTSRNIFKRFGLPGTLLYLGIALLQRFTFFRIYRVLCRERLGDRSASVWRATNESGFEMQVRPLKESEQDRLADQPEYGLSRQFIEQSRSNHAECIGLISSLKVLSYGWLGRNWAMIDGRFQIHPGPRMLYLHKLFTLPEMRGQHLLSRLLCGLIEQEDTGSDRFFSLVEIQNYSSLNGFGRAGFRPMGWLLLFSVGDRNFLWTDRGMKNSGIRFRLGRT